MRLGHCKFADYFTSFQERNREKGVENQVHVSTKDGNPILIDRCIDILIIRGTPFLPEEIAIKTINRYSTISLLRLRFLLPFLILFLMWCMPLDSKILPCKFSTKTFLTKEQQFAVYSKLYYTYWYSNIGHLLQFEIQLKM